MTKVIDFSLELPAEPDAIPSARRAVDRLAPTTDAVTLLNVRLLVSELVTNAVRHVPSAGDAGIQLLVEQTEDHVRVEVADGGPGFSPAPRVDTVPGEQTSGWGLHILAKVASRWGVESDHGARVWFELDAPVHRVAV